MALFGDQRIIYECAHENRMQSNRLDIINAMICKWTKDRDGGGATTEDNTAACMISLGGRVGKISLRFSVEKGEADFLPPLRPLPDFFFDFLDFDLSNVEGGERSIGGTAAKVESSSTDSSARLSLWRCWWPLAIGVDWACEDRWVAKEGCSSGIRVYACMNTTTIDNRERKKYACKMWTGESWQNQVQGGDGKSEAREQAANNGRRTYRGHSGQAIDCAGCLFPC